MEEEKWIRIKEHQRSNSLRKTSLQPSHSSQISTMKTKHRDAKSESLWSFNRDKKKRTRQTNLFTPIFDLLESAKASLIGPGAGAGVGCGVGVGFGVVGGYGFGGAQWNQLSLVLGIGAGCGVGLGIGYGQGFGYGYSVESLEAYLSDETTFETKKGKTKGLIGI